MGGSFEEACEEDCQHDFVEGTKATDNFVVYTCNICGKSVVGFDGFNPGDIQ